MKLSILACTSILTSMAAAAPLKANQDDTQQPILVNHNEDITAIHAKLPEVDSELLQSLITQEALTKRAEVLMSIANHSISGFGHPTRVIGSNGHWGTIGYIKDEMKKLKDYYTVSTQHFKAYVSEIYNASLTVNGASPSSLTEMDMSPSTPNKDYVNGPMVLVSNNGCSESDYPVNSVKDSIVLIKRGQCAFGDKSLIAGKLGAKAAIIYNNEKGEVRGTLGVPPPDSVVAPTVGISLEDGLKYIELLNLNVTLNTSVLVDSYVGPISTLNVIAESIEGDENNVVMLGAHSDSVTAGPGINDDGSGTISLLEVAKQLTNFKVNNKVRFAWWAAEEEGLLGSNHYAKTLTPEENIKIRLFMDYDMMASPNYEYEVYNASNAVNPVGSEELRNLYVDYYESKNLPFVFIPFDGRSDYVGFIENGIPGGGIATGAEKDNFFNGETLDPCYHSLCDDLTNLNYEAFMVNTKLIAHSVATYAKSLDGFPKREPILASSAASNSFGAREFKYRGSKLIM